MQIATGVCVVPSYLAANCAFVGGGDILTIDNEPAPEHTWMVDPSFNGENPRGNDNCSVTGLFEIKTWGPNPTYELYDENTSCAITWGSTVGGGNPTGPSQIILSGSVGGP